MKKTELKKVIELAKAYDDEVVENIKTGVKCRKHADEWFDLTWEIAHENAVMCQLIRSIVFCGLNLNLTEETIDKMLELAGIYEEV